SLRVAADRVRDSGSKADAEQGSIFQKLKQRFAGAVAQRVRPGGTLLARTTRATTLPKELGLGIHQAAHPGERHGGTPWRTRERKRNTPAQLALDRPARTEAGRPPVQFLCPEALRCQGLCVSCILLYRKCSEGRHAWSETWPSSESAGQRHRGRGGQELGGLYLWLS